MPDSLVVFAGMPRAGSTTLYHHLQGHPAAVVPYRKEIFFFSFYYDRGVEWYRHLYRKASQRQVAFDVSPGYFYDEVVIDRILAFTPSPKVILCLRDPVEWSLSLYNHLRGSTAALPPFSRFVDEHEIRVGNQSLTLKLRQNLVGRMVEAYRSSFAERLLLYDFELLRRKPLSVLQAVECFAGLTPHFCEENFHNVILNASNRRDSARLYHFLNTERTIALLRRLLPERLLAMARRSYYLATARGAPSDPTAGHSTEDVRLAEEIFADDRQVVRRVFEAQPIVLGSGEALSR